MTALQPAHVVIIIIAVDLQRLAAGFLKKISKSFSS